MNYIDKLDNIEKNDIIAVSTRSRSLDNGASWHNIHAVRRVYTVDDLNNEYETNRYGGPSMSGFWGNCNEIRSGNVDISLRRWDGKRWRKISFDHAKKYVK